jgi:UDP:flavonoid glycosyltransferase YjiC (YdhE family)
MRWLLTSWGSHGDLHPFLALGRGLLARGHQVTLVGHPDWAAETTAAGLRFVSTGEPSREDFIKDHPGVLSMKWGGLVSLHTLVHRAIAPGFDHVLSALLAETSSHDAIVAHHFAFPAPIAAELSGLPFATVSLAPGVVPSAWSLPGANFGRAGTGPLGRLWNKFIWSSGSLVSRHMVDPVVNQLRAKHGLRPVRDAIFAAHSPRLNLQLYSEHFAPRPPDWSAEKRIAGFCFYDPPDASLAPEIEKFLARGEPPILFTLGSVAVQNPGAFYQNAVQALTALKMRGILLIGPEKNRPAGLPDTVLAVPYAPYGLLMPRRRPPMRRRHLVARVARRPAVNRLPLRVRPAQQRPPPRGPRRRQPRPAPATQRQLHRRLPRSPAQGRRALPRARTRPTHPHRERPRARL